MFGPKKSSSDGKSLIQVDTRSKCAGCVFQGRSFDQCKRVAVIERRGGVVVACTGFQQIRSDLRQE